jgi:hypothetical protein
MLEDDSEDEEGYLFAGYGIFHMFHVIEHYKISRHLFILIILLCCIHREYDSKSRYCPRTYNTLRAQ